MPTARSICCRSCATWKRSPSETALSGAASNVGGLEFSLKDSLYAPIRSDPRVQAVIERLKVR